MASHPIRANTIRAERLIGASQTQASEQEPPESDDPVIQCQQWQSEFERMANNTSGLTECEFSEKVE